MMPIVSKVLLIDPTQSMEIVDPLMNAVMNQMNTIARYCRNATPLTNHAAMNVNTTYSIQKIYMLIHPQCNQNAMNLEMQLLERKNAVLKKLHTAHTMTLACHQNNAAKIWKQDASGTTLLEELIQLFVKANLLTKNMHSNVMTMKVAAWIIGVKDQLQY